MPQRGFFGPYRAGQLRQELDRLLSNFFEPAARGAGDVARTQPAVNVWEQDQAWHVEMEVPGVRSGDVDLSVVGDELTVRLTRHAVEPREGVYHRRERPAGAFTRVVRLPDQIDPEGVEARLKDGVLTIVLPRAAASKPRRIDVNVVA